MKDFISDEWKDYRYEQKMNQVYENYLYYWPIFLWSYWDGDEEEREDYFHTMIEDYYRDRTHRAIFYRTYKGRQIITGADYNTFTPLGMLYSRDRNYLYYEWERLSYDVNKTPRRVGEFIVDDEKVYHNFSQNILTGANPQTFKNIDWPNWWSIYYSDNSNVYVYDGKILENADVSSFEILDGMKAKDKNHVYENGKIVE